MQASGDFDGTTSAISAARRLTAGFLRRAKDERGVPVSDRSLDDAQLVVSELVTNAVRHAPGPCRVLLEIIGDRLRITVRDSSAALPTILAPDPARVGRHGMEIVVALCGVLSVAHRPEGGKHITVDLGLVT
ncbi:ATP-binding protein [Streptomyces sp. NPDC049040]|uniref:ATP-binding protein n=1 Tax=Streptomyces sp. NPDC049040 TaxID=3365593 RepID=UPI00371A2282